MSHARSPLGAMRLTMEPRAKPRHDHLSTNEAERVFHIDCNKRFILRDENDLPCERRGRCKLAHSPRKLHLAERRFDVTPTAPQGRHVVKVVEG